MPKPILQSAALVAISLSLAACQREQKVAATPAPTAPAPAAAAGAEQPALWSIEVMKDGKAVSRVDICADSTVRAGFARPAPEVNGVPCIRTKEPSESESAYAARCRAGGDLYAVSSGTTGDTSRDFTVEMAVTRQGHNQPTYQQVRRYRLQGACPPGWHIGDSAAPGDKELLDTISGKRRPMPPTAG